MLKSKIVIAWEERSGERSKRLNKTSRCCVRLGEISRQAPFAWFFCSKCWLCWLHPPTTFRSSKNPDSLSTTRSSEHQEPGLPGEWLNPGRGQEIGHGSLRYLIGPDSEDLAKTNSRPKGRGTQWGKMKEWLSSSKHIEHINTHLFTCVLVPSELCDKIPVKNNLLKERFILVHRVRRLQQQRHGGTCVHILVRSVADQGAQ